MSYALRCAPFVMLHLVPLAAFWTGLSWTALLLCLACYLINMVGVTVGYHRLLTHQAFESPRPVRLLFAIFGS